MLLLLALRLIRRWEVLHGIFKADDLWGRWVAFLRFSKYAQLFNALVPQHTLNFVILAVPQLGLQLLALLL